MVQAQQQIPELHKEPASINNIEKFTGANIFEIFLAY
jgi:hypothetical protein